MLLLSNLSFSLLALFKVECGIVSLGSWGFRHSVGSARVNISPRHLATFSLYALSLIIFFNLFYHKKNQQETKTQANRVYSADGTSVSLQALAGGLGAKTGLYDIDGRIRRLTPKECFRLQGFPMEMIDLAQKLKISDTQLYKMAGNAVSVNVIEAIAKELQKAIKCL